MYLMLPSFMYKENHIQSKFADAIEEYEKHFENNLPTEPGWSNEKGMIKDIKYCIKHKIKMEEYKPEIFEMYDNIEF